jgi:hypothetical protein
MRRLLPLLVVPVLALAVLYFVPSGGGEDGPEGEPAALPRTRPVPDAQDPVLQGNPVPRAEPAASLLPPSPEAALRAAWARAADLLRRGRAREAEALLAPFRERFPDFFADAERGPTVEAIRSLAVTEAGVDLVRNDRDRRDLQDRFEASAEILDRAASAEIREQLSRHLARFLVPAEVGVGPLAADAVGIDRLLGTLLRDEREWTETIEPLPRADPEAAEQHRLDQLALLAERGATELLEHVEAGLLWLALHQGNDGRFSDAAVTERCKSLGHEPSCLETHRDARDRYVVATTALAVLALLDFRDQDVQGVFEPALTHALRWLMAQQLPDGSFPAAGQLYSTAIAVMALGQAAASTGRPDVRDAAARGLARLALRAGPNGGFRYSERQPGDLSVSGWVAQAVEAGRAGEVFIPDGLEDGLVDFLDTVWKRDHRFAYVADGADRSTLFAVGMLMAHILWKHPSPDTLEAWRVHLAARNPLRPPHLYDLYYGLRVSLWLEEELVEPWRQWSLDLASKQVAEGDAAGSIPLDRDLWLRGPGLTVQTALSVLTLEHALYQR